MLKVFWVLVPKVKLMKYKEMPVPCTFQDFLIGFLILMADKHVLRHTKAHIVCCVLLTVVSFLNHSRLQAQDLEPRLLSPIPTGGNFAVASYGHSVGNILLDNTLPIEDLDASINSFILAYARSFKLFNKLGKFDLILPYGLGSYDAIVDGMDTSATRNGFGDPLVRFSMVFAGTGALNQEEFIKHVPDKFNLGAALRLFVPLGQYDPTKLINLGTSRWTIKFTLAGSYTLARKWIFEAHVNPFFFTENSSFFNGNTLKQKPLLVTQFHTSYVFKPGIWLAASFGRSFLGETILNGQEQDNLQNTSRYGLVFACRVSRRSALKLGFTSGITARYGADFTTLILAYQYIWFDKSMK
jgi:hypothetical protein